MGMTANALITVLRSFTILTNTKPNFVLPTSKDKLNANIKIFVLLHTMNQNFLWKWLKSTKLMLTFTYIISKPCGVLTEKTTTTERSAFMHIIGKITDESQINFHTAIKCVQIGKQILSSLHFPMDVHFSTSADSHMAGRSRNTTLSFSSKNSVNMEQIVKRRTVLIIMIIMTK